MIVKPPRGRIETAAETGGDSSSLVFVARQPILNRRQSVVGYELLYRSGPEDHYSANDGDFASRSVIGNSLITFGLPDIAQGRRAFINFTGTLLVQQTALVLPPDQIVVEVGDSVSAAPEVLQACWALKRAGYQFSLDGVAALPTANQFFPLADFVKVDFMRVRGEARQAIADSLLGRHHTLVADKVESGEDFAEAARIGYTLYQGNFFQRPEIVAQQSIPSSKLASLQLVKELYKPDVDWERLEQVLKQDVGLPVKLLRYLNSAWFGLPQQVDSLRHAMIMLGLEGLKQWVSLVVVTDLGQDKSPELITLSLLRATMCERLAKVVSLARHSSNLFLIGLFSCLDALVGRPLTELLNDLAVPEAVKDALLGQPGPLGDVFQLALAYEGADWDGLTRRAKNLGIDQRILPAIYTRSVDYVSQIVAPTGRR